LRKFEEEFVDDYRLFAFGEREEGKEGRYTACNWRLVAISLIVTPILITVGGENLEVAYTKLREKVFLQLS
jgi:hypothetical protein